MHNSFKSISTQNYITRFRNYIARQDKKRQKANKIDENIYRKLLNVRKNFLPAHDIDLCRCDEQTAKGYKVEHFRPPSFWFLGFATHHSIYLRRIINIVTYP